MTQTQLQAFSIVAKMKSFTSAAVFLGVSQSAVSHSVKSLEAELGVALFIRTRTDIILSEFGASILLKTHDILGHLESIKQEAQQSQNLHKGSLRIGSFGPSFSAGVLPIILKEYQRRYPNIKVYVEEAQDSLIKQWVMDRKIDLGSVILPEKELPYTYLTQDQVRIVLPRAHPLAVRDSINLKDLCEFPFILTEGRTGQMVLELFKAAKLKPDIAFNNIQIMSMLSMVSHGAGISATAQLSISFLEADAQSAYVLKPFKPALHREIALLMQNIKQLSPAAKAFVEIAAKLQRTGKLNMVLA
jgi:DNA-binding transcriptional LysR family regulator